MFGETFAFGYEGLQFVLARVLQCCVNQGDKHIEDKQGENDA